MHRDVQELLMIVVRPGVSAVGRERGAGRLEAVLCWVLCWVLWCCAECCGVVLGAGL